jgi:hypothetical protein
MGSSFHLDDQWASSINNVGGDQHIHTPARRSRVEAAGKAISLLGLALVLAGLAASALLAIPIVTAATVDPTTIEVSRWAPIAPGMLVGGLVLGRIGRLLAL